MLVSSVPLSLTTMAGLPRAAMRVSSSRATRIPDSEDRRAWLHDYLGLSTAIMEDYFKEGVDH